MKTITTVLLVFLIGNTAACNGQTTAEKNKKNVESESSKSEPGKQLNQLDVQTKMFNDIFELAGSGENNPLGGAENYIELLEKIDLPGDQKKMLREQYKVYDLSLDPAKKDSLKVMVGKLLEAAMPKSRDNPNN